MLCPRLVPKPTDVKLAKDAGVDTWDSLVEYLRVVQQPPDSIALCIEVDDLLGRTMFAGSKEAFPTMRHLVQLFYLASVRLRLMEAGVKLQMRSMQYVVRCSEYVAHEEYEHLPVAMRTWMFELAYKAVWRRIRRSGTVFNEAKRNREDFQDFSFFSVMVRRMLWVHGGCEDHYRPILFRKVLKVMLAAWAIPMRGEHLSFDSVFSAGMPEAMAIDLANRFAVQVPKWTRHMNLTEFEPLVQQARAWKGRWSATRVAWMSAVSRCQLTRNDLLFARPPDTVLQALDAEFQQVLSTLLMGDGEDLKSVLRQALCMTQTVCSALVRLQQSAGKAARKRALLRYRTWWVVLVLFASRFPASVAASASASASASVAASASAHAQDGLWRLPLWKFVKFMIRIESRRSLFVTLTVILSLEPVLVGPDGLLMPSVSRWVHPRVWAAAHVNASHVHALHVALLLKLQPAHRMNPF